MVGPIVGIVGMYPALRVISVSQGDGLAGREETVIFIESLLLNVLSGSFLNW